MKTLAAGSLVLLVLSTQARAETNSDHYQWLENPSPKRTAFVKAHNASTDASAQADPNYASIEYWLFQLYDFQHEIKHAALDSTHSLVLRETGLGKSTDLVLDSPDGETVLLSDSQSASPPTQNLVTFGVSPDKKHAFAVVEKDGSIDTMQIQLVDLTTQKILDQTLTTAEESIAWFSSTSLIYSSIDAQYNRFLSQYDLGTGQTKTYPHGALEVDGSRYVLYYDGTRQLLHDKTDQSDTPVSCWTPMAIVAEDDQGAALLCQGKQTLGEIRRFDKAAAGTPAGMAGTALVPQSDKPIRSVSTQGGSFFVTVRNGPDRWIRVYTLMGAKQAELPVPSCCSITAFKWGTPGKTFVATLAGAMNSASNFIYTLATNTWNRDPATVLVGTDGTPYQSSVVFATSEDGTQVPVRLTYRSDLKADGTHPVYFKSYGGFAEAGYLDPAYSLEYEEFLRRGGILAGPGLRGGDEYGPSWHAQATNQNKINTYLDLRAAAELVVKQGWTTADKIISTGTSNGGLTVAATGLLYPEDFGLVIPIAGVDDFLGKERMDARNQGWDGEFGSSADPKLLPSMTAISPLENAKNLGKLRFLIIDGLDDTRVNHTHSLKLQAALEELGGGAGRSELASFRDAGHALANFYYQNSIAWHANSLLWTAIFSQAGWKW